MASSDRSARQHNERTRRWRTLPLILLLGLAAACASWRGTVHSELTASAQGDGALAMADALEALIATGQDSVADREYAYKFVQQHKGEDTAATTFATAVVTARLVQQRGLLAANLVPDVERAARRSRELDPNFRDGAATLLLGSLYVIAPAVVLQHGDSEQGLALLEGLVATHPEKLENHLRLAEAYIALGDPDPARPHLCLCLAHKSDLRPDDQILLIHLFADAGSPPCPQTADAAP